MSSEKQRQKQDGATDIAGILSTRYTVSALLRGSGAYERSIMDTRDLVRLTHYLGENSGIRLVLHSKGGTRHVQAWLDVFGPATSTVAPADLDAACSLSLTLAETQVASELTWASRLANAYELTRIRTAPMFTAPQQEFHAQPEWVKDIKLSDQLAFAQPAARLDSAAELLGALSRAEHDTWVVTTLKAPSLLDQALVIDELDASMARDSRGSYAGAVVCARTIVASAGPVSPAVLAGLARRSAELEVVPIKAREAAMLVVDPVEALRGYAVAEGYAVALTRVPATASGKGVGIAIRDPSPERHPLDPPLAIPTTPIRLGTASDLTGARVDVTLDAQDLRRHMYVEGKSGSGKSALLKSIAISWLDTGHPLVVLDPHGDLADAVAAHSSLLQGRVTHLIRHGDTDHPIGINPLAEADPELWDQNVDELLASMARIIDPSGDGMFGERAKRTFWLVADAARHVYGEKLTIHVVQTLLLSQTSLQNLARAVHHIAPDAARRVRTELVNLPDREWNELASWYQSRFQMWQRTRALRATTGTGVDAIDMDSVLAGCANLVVDLSSTSLGDNVAGILGGLYLRKLRDAMGRRANRDVPVLVVFDEAHLFRDEAPDRLLAEGRKFGLAILIASQSADNLTPRLARAIEANVGSFVSLRTGINLAATASSRLGDWPAHQLTRLPDLTAAASLSTRGVPSDAFTLEVDYYVRAEADGWTSQRIAAAANGVAEDTLDALWHPYSDLHVPTDAEVTDVLANTISDIEGRRAAPGGQSTPMNGAESSSPEPDVLTTSHTL